MPNADSGTVRGTVVNSPSECQSSSHNTKIPMPSMATFHSGEFAKERSHCLREPRLSDDRSIISKNRCVEEVTDIIKRFVLTEGLECKGDVTPAILGNTQAIPLELRYTLDAVAGEPERHEEQKRATTESRRNL